MCFFWGTTYLGIRMALETFRPVTLLCLRFLLSGSVMMVGAVLAGANLPSGRELWETAGYGVIVLGIGNGALVFAEQWVPSGLASLFVTTAPFWLVGVEALAATGASLCVDLPLEDYWSAARAWRSWWVRRSPAGGQPRLLGGFLLQQLGCAGWAIGSILQRRQVSRAHSFVSGAVQQLATGLAYAIPAILHPEPIHWTTRGVGALIYLVIFGSIIGYSAYVFAMDRLPVAIASIYVYINPIVAVILGWVVYREPFGFREGIAAAIIFVGVWMIKRASVPVQKLGADQPAESGQ